MARNGRQTFFFLKQQGYKIVSKHKNKHGSHKIGSKNGAFSTTKKRILTCGL
jgi:hypothetical protein